MIKHILFLLLIPQILLFAQNYKATLTYKQIYTHLSTIESKAIILGDGDKHVYVFVDPLCQFSKKFITKVTQSKFMLKKYKYHIFLYELPRLHSKETINYIYNSPQRRQSLLNIMTKDEKAKQLTKPMKIDKQIVSDISNVAKKINVNKRPFIIVSQGVL